MGGSVVQLLRQLRLRRVVCLAAAYALLLQSFFALSIATQVAAADPQLPVTGLVLLGYPLHPPGRPTERRDKHLPAIARPMLFVQGTRDAFGTPHELTPILGTLRPAPALHVVAQGDHSFKLSRKDPAAQAAIYAGVQRAIVEFIRASIP